MIVLFARVFTNCFELVAAKINVDHISMTNWQLLLLLCIALGATGLSATALSLHDEVRESLGKLSLEELSQMQTAVRSLVEQRSGETNQLFSAEKHRTGRKLLGVVSLHVFASRILQEQHPRYVYHYSSSLPNPLCAVSSTAGKV